MSRINIDVQSLLRTDHLGDQFELPETPAIADALMIINEACSREVRRRNRAELEDFLATKFGELQAAIKEGACSNTKRQIMLSIVNYKRDKKLEL